MLTQAVERVRSHAERDGRIAVDLTAPVAVALATDLMLLISNDLVYLDELRRGRQGCAVYRLDPAVMALDSGRPLRVSIRRDGDDRPARLA